MSELVANHSPNWGPLGEKVYARTYSRIKQDGVNETWEETVRRVVNGNCSFVGESFIESDERQKLFDLIYDFKLLPGGRHLWATGITQGKEFINNCFLVGFDKNPATHFTLLFDLLMQGGGVGANYSERYLDHCDAMQNEVHLRILCQSDHPDFEEIKNNISSYSKEELLHNIGITHNLLLTPLLKQNARVQFLLDSREGWVEGLNSIFNAHMTGKVDLAIDVSLIRERGCEIKGFGGIACGPGPLIEMLIAVNDILNKIGPHKLIGQDAMAIDHEIARCVVSGGVRRSSRMAMKSWMDDDIISFIHCKSAGLGHWTTNISVEIDDEFFIALQYPDHFYHEQAKEVFSNCIDGMLRNGEPGFFNRSLALINDPDIIGTNPCGEINLEANEACILGHVNLSGFDSLQEQLEAFRLMTRFLMRATFAKMPNAEVKAVVKRNRRIGVGFFGYQEWCLKNGLKYSESVEHPYITNCLRLFKEVVDSEKRVYANKLHIPVPIKATCVAPTGSISNLPGVTGAFQTIYRKYFKRRIRYQDNHPEFLELVKTHEVETDITDPSGHTQIIVNYCEDTMLEHYPEELIEAADEISLETYLAIQAMVQRIYADNAISFTVNIIPDSISKVRAAAILLKWLPRLKGTTIFPDLSRPQSPFEKITKEQFLTHHGIVDQSEQECLNGSCPIR